MKNNTQVFVILCQKTKKPTLFELFVAGVAHPGGLVVVPLQRSLAARANAAYDAAASAAVVAPVQEREFRVALLKFDSIALLTNLLSCTGCLEV